MPRLQRALAFLCWIVLAGFAFGQVSVLTQHNDVARTGQNPNETILTTSNVNVAQFGKLFARTVDGQIYAQPLYLSGLTIGGKTRNVVFVATEHNTVFAFDADDPNASSPLWQVNLGTSVPSQDICSPGTTCYYDLTPEIGITSTPVIDPASGTIYVVAKSKDTSTSTYHFKLHALDVLTGAEKFSGPVEIVNSGFQPLYQLNRPGLLLLNGVVYVAFGSVGDNSTWHGWIFGFNSSTLQPVAVYNATPNGCCGGFWSGGAGLAADADNIYAITGNGTFDVNTGGSDYGDSIVKLSTSSSLHVSDYFTPDDQSTLFTNDNDLGSGGPLLLPSTSLLVAAGKDGILRLISTASMGKFNPTFNSDVQELQATSGQVLGAFVYADSPSFGPAVYLWGPGDVVKAWAFNGSTFRTAPASQSTIVNAAGDAANAPLAISSNQNQSGTGIVWAVRPSTDPGHQVASGTLYAFDANNLANDLWDTGQNPARDGLGNYAKFSPPTIANGKVYVATFSGQLVVYGLNPPAVSRISYLQGNPTSTAPPQGKFSTVSVPYSNPQIAGDLNIVVVGWNDITSSVSSVTDSLGNTYTLAVGPTRSTSSPPGTSQSIYYAKNIKAGSNTVTATFNQAANYPDVRVLEYAGADTNSPLDVTATGGGISATASTGSANTTGANELIFGADTISTGTPGPGAGFTVRIITPHDSDLAEDEIGGNPGAYSATAPVSPSGYWVMQMATFKVQSTATTSAPKVSSISPSSGSSSGGTVVSITGINFAAGATVTFGGTAATSVTFSSSTSITAVTPAHSAGVVDVVVTNSDGQSGTLMSGFTFTAVMAATSTSITSGLNPSAVGQPVTLAATVTSSSAGAPTGSVTFYDGATAIGSAALSGSSASLATSFLTSGTHSLTAAYSGDADFTGSTSAALSQAVNQAATAVSLASSVNPSLIGQTVTFTAIVSGQYGGTPTGLVNFKQGVTVLQVATLSSGQASYTTIYTTAGTRAITALYSGDSNYLASTSAVLNQVVKKVSTSTALTSSQNPSNLGQAVTFTATVSSGSPDLGLPSPAGAVSFIENGTTQIGSAALSGGVATFTTSSLPAGTQLITAVYSGSPTYLVSSSAKLSQTVNGVATTTTLVSSLNPSTYGQSITFTATVTPASGSGVPTGTITFKSGTSTLAKVPLTSATASYSTATLSAGTKSITAVYSGDSTYAGSTSAALSQVIAKATTTTTLTSSQNPSTSGQFVTFTATVSPEYSGTPTWSVTFKQGTTTLQTVTMSGEAASFTTSTLPTGSDTITATYNGSANFNASSASITQTVNP